MRPLFALTLVLVLNSLQLEAQGQACRSLFQLSTASRPDSIQQWQLGLERFLKNDAAAHVERLFEARTDEIHPLIKSLSSSHDALTRLKMLNWQELDLAIKANPGRPFIFPSGGSGYRWAFYNGDFYRSNFFSGRQLFAEIGTVLEQPFLRWDSRSGTYVLQSFGASEHILKGLRKTTLYRGLSLLEFELISQIKSLITNNNVSIEKLKSVLGAIKEKWHLSESSRAWLETFSSPLHLDQNLISLKDRISLARSIVSLISQRSTSAPVSSYSEGFDSLFFSDSLLAGQYFAKQMTQPGEESVIAQFNVNFTEIGAPDISQIYVGIENSGGLSYLEIAPRTVDAKLFTILGLVESPLQSN